MAATTRILTCGAAALSLTALAVPGGASAAEPPTPEARLAVQQLQQLPEIDPSGSPDMSDYRRAFFRIGDAQCEIGPNGGLAGCGMVPRSAPDGAMATMSASYQAGRFEGTAPRQRPETVQLGAGQKTGNEGSECGRPDAARLVCTTGPHGFLLVTSGTGYATFW